MWHAATRIIKYFFIFFTSVLNDLKIFDDYYVIIGKEHTRINHIKDMKNLTLGVFTEDQEVIAIASQLIVVAGLFQYADGLQAVGAAMLRGITDVKVPMVIALVSYIIVGLSVGLLCAFPLKMGAAGIWIGFICGLALAAICFHIRFNYKFKQL